MLGCFPWTVLAVVIALASGLVFLSRSSDEPRSQETYAEEIGQARRQLFTGRLIHTDARSLGLVAGAEPRPFRVEVMGSWGRAGRPGETQSPVSAGAQIGAKLHCSGAGVTCTPLSSERQNVLSRNDRATWVWDVSAQRAGKVGIALTVTAYMGEGDTVLVEKPPVTSRVDVAAPPGDHGPLSWAKGLWRWLNGVATSLGGLALSVSAVIALVLTVIRWRSPAADADRVGTTEGVRGAGRRIRERPVRHSRSVLGRRTRLAVVRRRRSRDTR
ncbi:hypothetical protein AMK26_15030 [Streptomyces sp. CB03234]|uniref:hypothetical protein n=1 Tax=Streptomyces sp. (strain CB03234) TaxID=1703937 RepID=UPI00093BF767|nr:hypothetical protein [Streptomyces sp. CB03234]OKK04632.1 hypothetical protein AMK26_15030 [Streptomyces sp. CB03234]